MQTPIHRIEQGAVDLDHIPITDHDLRLDFLCPIKLPSDAEVHDDRWFITRCMNHSGGGCAFLVMKVSQNHDCINRLITAEQAVNVNACEGMWLHVRGNQRQLT